jgi:outer membrane protein assembly factor BamD (BamD/ComL family)
MLKDPELKDTTVIALFDSMFTNRELSPEAKMRQDQLKREREARQSQFAQQLPDTLKFKNKPPRRSSLPEDSLKTLISKNQLELGNMFLTELNMPDSAYWYYNNILTVYPNTYYQATAMYSLGSYYLTVDEKNRADSLFNLIYENYKKESIVNAAADKLNKPFIDLKYDPAEDAYKVSETYMLNGNYTNALEGFYNIFETYPQSPFAPKALYTCGWIMENEIMELDSAAVFYDSLVVNYPASEYVRKIAPKLSFYKQEKRKIETAMQDSLLSHSHNGIDSLTQTTDLNGIDDSLSGKIDSVQVALDEKPVTQPKDNGVKKTEIQLLKEPVWNPRRRK